LGAQNRVRAGFLKNFPHFVPIFLKCRISNGICVNYPVSDGFEPIAFTLRQGGDFSLQINLLGDKRVFEFAQFL